MLHLTQRAVSAEMGYFDLIIDYLRCNAELAAGRRAGRRRQDKDAVGGIDDIQRITTVVVQILAR